MRILRALHVLFVAIVLAGVPTDAHAYLDPSTGAMLMSAVVSIVVTASLAVQAYWYRIVRAVRRVLGRAPADAAPHSEDGGTPGAKGEGSRP